MAIELILTPETEEDLAAAYDWYEACRPGLGEDFLSCVDAAFHVILRQPNSFPIAKDEFRRYLVRRFPYQIFYESDDSAVTIYGVFHTSRDPKVWQDRLQ